MCGCGNCTLDKFLKEGCPNPGGERQFPLLNLRQLSSRSSQKLYARLIQESKRVAEKFATVTCEMLKCLNAKEDITVDELVLFVLPLQRFSFMSEPHISEIQEQLRQATTKGHVLKLLSENHVSWFNHSLFESIVRKFNVANDEYQEYVTEYLQPLLKKSLFEIPHKSSDAFKGSGQFVLKMGIPEPAHKIKADVLILLKDRVARALGISVDALDFCYYESGCLEVVFSAPYELIKETFAIRKSFSKILQPMVGNLKIQSVRFENESQTLEVSCIIERQ